MLFEQFNLSICGDALDVLPGCLVAMEIERQLHESLVPPINIIRVKPRIGLPEEGGVMLNF